MRALAQRVLAHANAKISFKTWPDFLTSVVVSFNLCVSYFLQTLFVFEAGASKMYGINCFMIDIKCSKL